MKKMTFQTLKRFSAYLKKMREKNHYKPFYKLIDILEGEEEYIVAVKIVNKNITFNIKPEAILANDHLVDQFSPRDIRTLTYLGYLGINAPKYKILAKKLLQNEKISFLLKKKGDEKIIIKTAEEIMRETDIINNVNSKDANTIGYTFASEVIHDEKKQKTTLLKELETHSERLAEKTNECHE